MMNLELVIVFKFLGENKIKTYFIITFWGHDIRLSLVKPPYESWLLFRSFDDVTNKKKQLVNAKIKVFMIINKILYIMCINKI